MTLGQNIRERRQSARLSQEKLAELVGVSRQAVTKWEAGQSSPSTENLFRLAEILGTTVDLLVSSGGPSDPPPAKPAKNPKRNLRMALAVAAAYLLTYLIGRMICGNFSESSLLGWLTGTDSRYYLFGWLTHQRLFWGAMAVSVLPALLGKFRLSAAALAGFEVGLVAGELLGPYPAGEAIGHSHYGWAIWGGVFLASLVAGAVWELRAGKQRPEG